MFKWKEVKRLKAEGFGIKVIARKLKISKNTVKKYLKSIIPPVFNKPARQSVLIAFKTEIEDMLKNEFIGTRIHNELKRLGYYGSLSSVHRFLRHLKSRPRQTQSGVR